MRSFAAATLAVLLAAAASPLAQKPAAPLRGDASARQAEAPCDIRTTERVVAIGDIHGAYPQFRRILQAAALIDARDRWIGGRARLVQTGDVLDRGPDSRRAIDLLRRLERDAAEEGGRVHALLGNHEFMRIVADWRYVSAGELKAFVNADSTDLRERVHAFFAQQDAAKARSEKRTFDEPGYRTRFMKEFPLGYFDMQLAFGKEGEYGKWVRSRVPAVKINGVLFMHGGVSDRVADLGCEGMNAEIQRDLAVASATYEKLPSLLSSAEDGPLWYRGMASEPEDTFAPTLESILQRFKARAVVLGHTPVPEARITTRFGGRVVLIDTGMLNGEFYPRGVPSALEMKGDTLTAIYEGRREPIRAPALALSTQ
jgi:hypothetical protein